MPLPYIFLLVAFSTRLACAAPGGLAARAIVALGPQDTCPATQDTLYELQLVYYSSFVPQNTVIDPFHDGHLITISNAPTVLVLQTFLTTVVTRQATGGSDAINNLLPTAGDFTILAPTLRGPSRFSSTQTSSYTIRPTTSPIIVNGQTITPGASAVTINGTSVSLAAGSTVLVIGTQTVQPGVGNSAVAAQTIVLTPNTPNLVVAGQIVFPGEITTINGIQIIYAADGAYALIGTSTIYPGSGTATVAGSAVSLTATTSDVLNTGSGASGAQASSTSSLPPLTIGVGIQSGSFTSLPTESPILLAFSDMNLANKRLIPRQAPLTPDPAEPTSASAVTVVSLASLTATAPPSSEDTDTTVAASDCDNATPFILSEGLLLHDGSAVGKIRIAQTALLGPLAEPPNDQVNKTFSIQNGILHWDTDNVGSAIFCSCSGTLYTGFPQAPDGTCTSVVLGVIAAQACEAWIAQISGIASMASALPATGLTALSSSPIPMITVSLTSLPNTSPGPSSALTTVSVSSAGPVGATGSVSVASLRSPTRSNSTPT